MLKNLLPSKPGTEPLAEALRACKTHFIWAFVFSALVNLLYLTPTLYMMQVYDRVLASQSEATLLALTLISLFLIAMYGVLEGCRSFALIGLGRLVDRRLSSRVFDALFVKSNDFSCS